MPAIRTTTTKRAKTAFFDEVHPDFTTWADLDLPIQVHVIR